MRTLPYTSSYKNWSRQESIAKNFKFALLKILGFSESVAGVFFDLCSQKMYSHRKGISKILGM